MKSKILVVDDEAPLLDTLTYNLKKKVTRSKLQRMEFLPLKIQIISA